MKRYPMAFPRDRAYIVNPRSGEHEWGEVHYVESVWQSKYDLYYKYSIMLDRRNKTNNLIFHWIGDDGLIEVLARKKENPHA